MLGAVAPDAPGLERQLEDSARVFMTVLPMILLAGLAILSFRIVSGTRHAPVRHTMLDVLTALSVAGVLAATLVPTSGRGATFLTPLEDLRSTLGIPGFSREAAILIGGNVLMFVPLGMCIAARARRWRIVLALAASLALSGGVETVQYLFMSSRSASVDDVMLNTLGGLLGGIAWARLAPARERP